MATPATSLDLWKFRRLASAADDVWQGGVFRLPALIEQGPHERPYRPWGGLWVSERTGLVHLEPEPSPEAHDHGLALAALLRFGLDHQERLGGRPARLRVTDPELASYLTAQIEDRDTVVEVVSELPEVRAVLAGLAEELADGPLIPGALAVPGVGVDRLRAFAEAAAAFFAAAPWEHLQNEDLISVGSPKWPRNLSRVAVMGNAGINFGLAFFDSRAAFERMVFSDLDVPARAPASSWSLHFGSFDDLPLDDADAWERLALPVAGELAYPCAIRVEASGVTRRPDARELTALEALLRALAATTEDQLDSGQWVVDVMTADGARRLEMALPLLVEAERDSRKTYRLGAPDRRVFERTTARIQRFLRDTDFASLEAANQALAEAQRGGLFDAEAMPDDTELSLLERAQELVCDAAEAGGRLRVKRARQALAVTQDCADAWVMLAEGAAGAKRSHDLYQRAVEAGERALGPAPFETQAGHFWGLIETRPYMRARFGLAQQLQRLGEREAAAAHYEALIRLNPSDNQGARYELLPLLLALGRDEDVGRLLDSYETDIGAEMAYGRALWLYRRDGDAPPARAALRRAMEANPYVAWFLLHPGQVPVEQPPHYAFGSPEEAAGCVAGLRVAWEAAPGALIWLRNRTPAPRRSRSRAVRGSRGRRR